MPPLLQFGIASGIAIVGAIFYAALGGLPSRATFVSAMDVAMAVDAAILVGAAATTLLLPRRARLPGPLTRPCPKRWVLWLL